MTFKGINWKLSIDEAVSMAKSGKSLAQVGRHFGVSSQRIAQVFKKYGIVPADVGMKVVTRKRREAEAANHFQKWGDKSQTLYAVKRTKFLAKKNNAKRVGDEFVINFADIVWPTHCPILGMELNYEPDSRQENSISFDCVNPLQGYVPGNVCVMSWRANRIKNDGTADEHKLIYEFMQKYVDTKQ